MKFIVKTTSEKEIPNLKKEKLLFVYECDIFCNGDEEYKTELKTLLLNPQEDLWIKDLIIEDDIAKFTKYERIICQVIEFNTLEEFISYTQYSKVIHNNTKCEECPHEIVLIDRHYEV